MGLNPTEDTWKFSGTHITQSLRLSSKCEDHFLNSYAEYVDQNEVHDVNLLCFLIAFLTNVDVINESSQLNY